MTTRSTRAPPELTRAWAAKIRNAEDIIRQRQDRSGALALAKAAAQLATKIGEPTPLRRSASVLESLGGEPSTIARIRRLAEKARRKTEQNQKGGEPAALFEAIGIVPEAARGTVFKYLDYESGPSHLRKVRNKALIACTSRTGSTLLCAHLQRIGLDAQEHFNLEHSVRDASFAGEARTIRDYGNRLGRVAVSNNWFVTKGALETLLFLSYLGEFPEHSAEWKIIYIRRRNVIRQAISMEIAEKTQQWHVGLSPTDIVGPNDYSFESLWKHLQYVFAANSQWERAFILLGLTPHRVFFEDFISNTRQEMRSVTKFLGIAPSQLTRPDDRPLLPVSQSTTLNDAWERRFRQDLANRLFPRRCLDST
ncbi:MAG TPA: Stf0 family sulfotransferase [Rhizomicrobium sp.]|nr:Stf0 family sulfotransferase [Rhizomicrobium sp.]